MKVFASHDSWRVDFQLVHRHAEECQAFPELLSNVKSIFLILIMCHSKNVSYSRCFLCFTVIDKQHCYARTRILEGHFERKEDCEASPRRSWSPAPLGGKIESLLRKMRWKPWCNNFSALKLNNVWLFHPFSSINTVYKLTVATCARKLQFWEMMAFSLCLLIFFPSSTWELPLKSKRLLMESARVCLSRFAFSSSVLERRAHDSTRSQLACRLVLLLPRPLGSWRHMAVFCLMTVCAAESGRRQSRSAGR